MTHSEHLSWLPRGRNAVVLVVAMLVGAFGTGMFLAGSAIFFTTAGGLTRVEFATGLAIASVVGLVSSLPVSSLADWAGPRRVLVLAYLWRCACFVVLAFTTGPVAFAAAAAAQAVAQQSSTPILQALIGTVTTDANRTSTMALIRSVRNLGFSLGALAAAPLLVADALWLNRLLMIGTGVALGLSGLVLLLLRTDARPTVAGRNPFAGVRSVTELRYVALSAANGVLALHMTLLAVGLPLWIATLPQVNHAVAPALVFLNTVLAVVAQVPFSRGVDSPASARRATWRAAACLAACCGALAATDAIDSAVLATGALVVAALLLTCGELWQAVGAWELSFSLSPAESRSSYLAVFGLGVSAQEALGPLLVAGLVIASGAVGWVLLGVLFLLGGAATAVTSRRIATGRDVEQVATA